MPRFSTHRTQVKASTDPLTDACGFQLRLPDTEQALRCLFVINQRGAGRHLFEQDTAWQALAARVPAGFLFCEFEAIGVRDNGYGAAMIRACDQFATALKCPRLRHLPFVLWGHSMGGRVAQDFARFAPDRVLAFHIGLRAFPSPAGFMAEEPEAMAVPALYLMGEEDSTPEDIREHFLRARAAGAPRAWVPLRGEAHWPRGMGFNRDETTDADWQAWVGNAVLIPWTEAVIALRLSPGADPRGGPVALRPIDTGRGWLGENESGRIAARPSFPGDPAVASWFPTAAVAAAWQSFSFPDSAAGEMKGTAS